MRAVSALAPACRCPTHERCGAQVFCTLNLREAPYAFPAPMMSHTEGELAAGYTDKRLGVWAVADLPEPAFSL